MREMQLGICLCNPILVNFLLLLLPIAALGTSVSSIQPTTMLTVVNTTLPGCPRKCGNLTVPYPCGITLNLFENNNPCSFSFLYDIQCNTSYNPPRAFLLSEATPEKSFEVIDISKTQVTVKNSQVAFRCSGDNEMTGMHSFGKSVFPYSYSNTENVLTVVGCDSYASVVFGAGNDGFGNYSRGCVALCPVVENLQTDGSCAGWGCCQSSIPRGLDYFKTDLRVLTISSFQRCAYSFLAKRGTFKFHGTSDFDDPATFINRTLDEAPIVLDWAIFNASVQIENGHAHGVSIHVTSCNDARKNLTSYACKANTDCIDLDNGGYRCQCHSSYEGNPYLNCTDIDDCTKGLDTLCSHLCVNTPGGYECSCPKGFHGDGYNNGTGCATDPSFTKYLIIGVSSGIGSITLLLAGFWLCIYVRRSNQRKQRAKNFKQNGGLLLRQQMSSSEGVVGRTKIFTASELEAATDNFNRSRIIGQGGQGTVYKGMLTDGRIVAIKKSTVVDRSQLKQFVNEVVILSQINHRNVVKLLGCCLETEVPLLVYEFIPNGTLFQHIHYPSEEFPVTWEKRLQIATDTAGALAYLHSASSMPIYHRDIKSSNILLDDLYRAVLSDFGISRCVAIDQTHLTTRVLGTFGYLDPEYFRSSQLTEKSDVYGFGVVLVELLTGQKPIRSTGDDSEEKSLVRYFLMNVGTSHLIEILDARVVNEGKDEDILAVADLARQCLALYGQQRPTMKVVAMELESIKARNTPPSHRNLPAAELELVEMRGVNYDEFSSLDASSFETITSNSIDIDSLLFNYV